MKIFHKIYRVVPFCIILILFFSCSEKQDERVSRGHLDAVKIQCKNKSDTKLCSIEVKKSFIENGHRYVTFEDLSKSQTNEVKLNCAPEKDYGLVAYNDCLEEWKDLALKDKLTDPDNERERIPKDNIEKLKEYTYYVLAGTETDPFGAGTGVAIDEHYIATNCHIIHKEEGNRFTNTIKVWNLFDDKKQGRVKLFKEGYSKDIDICILKTKTKLKYVKKKIKFSKLKQTDFVRALGNPVGIKGHTADGNINALEVFKKDFLGYNLKTPNKIIVHDAAMGSGSSGGPLFDLAGNLVGINTWVISSKEATDGQGGVYVSGGFGHALSADHIKDVLKD
jgi:S1-C subfamily serine protease|tara:strand:+ start:4552 stop:5559 length:1008 start_codon:yes stop_codon:yes gene_type:complete